MKNVVKILIFIIHLLIILAGINFLVDPGNIFHLTVADEMAANILAGKDTYVLSGNYDARGCAASRIQQQKDIYDIGVIGPSLCMLISSEMVDNNSFMNYGYSSANYFDILATFDLFRLHNKLPKTLIWCTDSYIFDSSKNIPYLTKYTQDMLAFLDLYHPLLKSIPLPITQTNVEKENQNSKTKCSINLYTQLFNFSYFQQAIKLLNIETLFLPRVSVVPDGYTGAYWHSDGHYEYALSYQKHSIEDVQVLMNNFINADMNQSLFYGANNNIDENNKEGFERIVSYAKLQGTDIVLFLCPFPPKVWDILVANQEKYHAIFELDTYLNQFADINGLRVIGSYNPYKCGVTDADFYDARHLRKEALSAKFDFHISSRE